MIILILILSFIFLLLIIAFICGKIAIMKANNFLISTLRDTPSEAVIESHRLMLKAGLIRKLGNGLYTYMPMGLRSLNKVQVIIRQELNAIGCLEIKPTVIVPGDLWKESGRWDTMGPQMLKAQNRQGQDMVVSPTAEEAFTAIVRDGLTSYKQLPLTLYQINTKYRDEIRPRYGVMRGREFLMMDAYSFNQDDASLDASYKAMATAYHKIFKRLDLPIITVKADSGAMGGSGSEEFMVESAVGDDTLIICPQCSYAANVEKATCTPDTITLNDMQNTPTTLEKEEVATPDVFSISDMEKFFGVSAKHFIKCLIYKAINANIDLSKASNATIIRSEDENGVTLSYFCVLIRGDLDVNETKLSNVLQASEVALADEDEVLKYSGTVHGFVGPTTAKVPLIMDKSVCDMHDSYTGAGKKDMHLRHVEVGRDFTPFMTCDVRVVKQGDKCPVCNAVLYSKKGNELGHIFKLGHKYTHSMHLNYLTKDSALQEVTMGCYGIGVDRTLASVIESHCDSDGIIWPMSIAPYHVCIVPIQYKDNMKEVADKVYNALQEKGIEVLLDDRDLRPGIKFKDMDLLGIPCRIVVGDKNLPNVELKLRKEKTTRLVDSNAVIQEVVDIVHSEISALQ